ncbi:hypothetical protein F5Y18DRAFT_351368 [Xylariaceae sp. FL1019]|nr:hypothetical protein F5Y18DRAFT_351368 [Xylariaceae sp. FL1019]
MASRIATRSISLVPPARRLVAPQRWSFPRAAPCLAPTTLVPASRRFAHSIPKPPRSAAPTAPPNPDDAASPDASAPSDPIPRKQLEPHYQLTFTCVPCGERSSHTVSKQGYHKGSVLITCPECRNRHVISDHLNIFGDRHLTVEDLMREKGQLVKRGTLGEDGDIEFWQDDIAPSSTNNNTTPVHPSATAPSTRRQFSTISFSSKETRKPQVYTDRSPRTTAVDPKHINSNAESPRHEEPTGVQSHFHQSFDQPSANPPAHTEMPPDHEGFADLELSRKLSQLRSARLPHRPIGSRTRIYLPSKRVSHEEMLHLQIQQLDDKRSSQRLQERAVRNEKIQAKRERRKIQQEAERQKLAAAAATIPMQNSTGGKRQSSELASSGFKGSFGTEGSFDPAAALAALIKSPSKDQKVSSEYEAFFTTEKPLDPPTGRITPRRDPGHKHALSTHQSPPPEAWPLLRRLTPATSMHSPRKNKLKRGVLKKHGSGYVANSDSTLVRKFFTKPTDGLLTPHEAEREARLQMARSRISSTVRKVYGDDPPPFDEERAVASILQVVKNKPHTVRDGKHAISENVRKVGIAEASAFKRVYGEHPPPKNPPPRNRPSKLRSVESGFHPPGGLMGIQSDLPAGFSAAKAKAVADVPNEKFKVNRLSARNPLVRNSLPELKPMNWMMDRAGKKKRKRISRFDSPHELPIEPKRVVRIGD